jgi:hypothetical protein
LQLAGNWHRVENGVVVTDFSIRKFQGLGNTTKEAKYAAASAAIVNLGDMMPG